MTNPYAAPPETPSERAIFCPEGALRQRSFLYRVIEFEGAIPGKFIYDSWWFRQKITFGGETLRWKVSWLAIDREVSFSLTSPEGKEIPCRLEIGFTRGLLIQRFRLWFDENLVYDEIN